MSEHPLSQKVQEQPKSDKAKIIVGLLVFLAIALAPFYLGAGKHAPRPVLSAPTNGTTQCVESVEFMRDQHMVLLDVWRDKVVRDSEREYVGRQLEPLPSYEQAECKPPGKLGKDGLCRYEMSLSKTCMACHQDYEGFCNACHTYASVAPYCWDCHVRPDQVAKKPQVAGR